MMLRPRSWFGRRLRGTRAPIREIPAYYALMLDEPYRAFDEVCPWCNAWLAGVLHHPYCSRECAALASADNRRG